MAISKYTLYEYVKVAGTWRYCKAAYHNSKTKPDIVFVNVKQGAQSCHLGKAAPEKLRSAIGGTARFEKDLCTIVPPSRR
jgi:hypothetical protein